MMHVFDVCLGELMAFMVEREIESRMREHPTLSTMMLNAIGGGGGSHSKGVRTSLAGNSLVRFPGGAVVLLLGPALQLRQLC